MARTARPLIGGMCYHILNRGNARARIFRSQDDYAAFLERMLNATERFPLRVLAYCLLPDHFHLVVWPRDGGDLSRWMQSLASSYAGYAHRRHDSSGHLWQGRYKTFPIQRDEHLLAVLRYVEGNPLRLRLVERAEAWTWSSLAARRARECPEFLAAWPVVCPRDWVRRVNRMQSDSELAALRRSVVRGQPFGDEAWVHRTARRLGLESTLRPRGRPRTSNTTA